MLPYYLHAKATVLTSLYEGFPNALVESITLGTPVVAFDCPSGPSEIIQDGVNGYLVKHKDIESFTEKLIKLMSHKFNAYEVLKTVTQNQGLEVVEKYANCIGDISE